jgi:hypothetical protein
MCNRLAKIVKLSHFPKASVRFDPHNEGGENEPDAWMTRCYSTGCPSVTQVHSYVRLNSFQMSRGRITIPGSCRNNVETTSENSNRPYV